MGQDEAQESAERKYFRNMIIETGEKPKRRTHSEPESRLQAECFAWFWNKCCSRYFEFECIEFFF